MGASAKERLSALERTHDGFELAEIDLELRGPGDFFGTRQSGLPNLRMARFSDRGLLESARELAARVASEDPELSAHSTRRLPPKWPASPAGPMPTPVKQESLSL